MSVKLSAETTVTLVAGLVIGLAAWYGVRKVTAVVDSVGETVSNAWNESTAVISDAGSAVANPTAPATTPAEAAGKVVRGATFGLGPAGIALAFVPDVIAKEWDIVRNWFD